jgi:hypothetical protein
LKDRQAIDDHKKKKLPGLITLVGVNISFSHKGFVEVRKLGHIMQSKITQILFSLILAGD